jgi:CheY-like chemotaxis protein
MARTQVFDLIMMDVHMPDLDGLEATRRIRLLPKGQLVPIVAMTAGVLPGEREACTSAGMCDVLAKPIDTAQLYRCVHTWLNTVRAPNEPGITPGSIHPEPPPLLH